MGDMATGRDMRMGDVGTCGHKGMGGHGEVRTGGQRDKALGGCGDIERTLTRDVRTGGYRETQGHGGYIEGQRDRGTRG